MVVAAAIKLVFVAGNTVMEGYFAGQTAFGQQLERAINRRESDLRVFFPGQTEQLIGGKVIASFQKSAQDGIALVCMLEANTFQVLVENVLRLAHGFPRRRSVVVNSSLQHENLLGIWLQNHLPTMSHVRARLQLICCHRIPSMRRFWFLARDGAGELKMKFNFN